MDICLGVSTPRSACPAGAPALGGDNRKKVCHMGPGFSFLLAQPRAQEYVTEVLCVLFAPTYPVCLMGSKREPHKINFATLLTVTLSHRVDHGPGPSLLQAGFCSTQLGHPAALGSHCFLPLTFFLCQETFGHWS